jgi:threonine dehydratase
MSLVVIPTIDDVRAAARRIVGTAWPTPMMPSRWLSRLTGADVWLKLETVQATGSYKIRGAANAVGRHLERHPNATTIITASAGNHGQGLALAASRAGVRARVHVPRNAPDTKKSAIAAYGADLVEAESYEAAEANAHADAAASGLPFISPYNHPDIVSGAGTVALEMIEAQPSLDTFIAPVGGGGLLSGIAIVARALVPGALVIGAEAEASPVYTAALAAGHPVTVQVGPTLADGLAGNMDPDSFTFAIVRDLVDRISLIAEPRIEEAMRELILRERLVAEGAAAVAVGAAIDAGTDLRGRRVGVVLSGRNVDAQVILQIMLA